MKHLFSKHAHARIMHFSKEVLASGNILMRLSALAVFVAVVMGINASSKPFVSPEMMFTDASASRLAIVPASGASEPPRPTDPGPVVVTPSCPSYGINFGWACGSAANACGMTNRGTIECDGVTCSASTPPDSLCTPSGCGPGTLNDRCPACTGTPVTVTACGQTSTWYPCPAPGHGVTEGTPDTSIPYCPGWVNPDSPSAGGQCWSAPNACGERTEGVIQPSGLCNASPPPNSCMLPGGGWSGAGAGLGSGASPVGSPFPDPFPEPPPPPPPPGFVPFRTTAPGSVFTASGHLQARPTLVRFKEKTRLYWNLTNVSSCSVTGTNGDVWSGGHSGSSGALSGAIEMRTTYTLRCTALPGSGAANITESVIINIAPQFNES